MSPPASQAASPALVLVIDDDTDIRQLVDVRMRQGAEPVEILHAPDAQTGLQLASERNPDAILLDLDLPGRSGLEVCRALQEDPRLRAIPVLFLSGTFDVSAKVKAFEAGATDYVTKPFDAVELRARVHAALRTTKYRRHLERAARQRETLLKLSVAHDPSWAERLRSVLKHDTLTLGVARVSYWRLVQAGQAFECEALYRADTGAFESGLVIKASDYPRYFQALRTNAPIVASDAQRHPDTSEFAESYLRPLGIGAMMDVPVFVGGALVGVVCHEHVGGTRAWAVDEEQFAVSIGQTLSMALESEERRRVEEVLRHSALHDALTGLPNRVFLFDVLRRELGRAQRDTDYRFALLYFDLDGFKPINDEFGHEVGDQLLVSVARRVSESLRSMDAAARVGGDEFAVVIANVGSAREVEEIAARIEAAIVEPHRINGHVCRVGASVGVALSETHHRDASAMLRVADEAMYVRKRSRRAAPGT